MADPISFTLNGLATDVAAPPEEPLLFALRNRLGLRASHFGCGLEQCGACMVGVDGQARYACTLPLADVAGAEIVTADGLPHDSIGRALVEAFAAEHAGQCGYCLGGILMSAYLLLRKNPAPDRAAIVAALEPHLCRCGAHNQILRAVERAANALESA
jgi:nicotinate dehydrogenase subunit A